MSRIPTRGLVFHGPGNPLAIEELELDPPGEGEVLVRMVASGVCRRSEPWLCEVPRGRGHRLNSGDVRLRRPDGTPIGVYSGIGTFGERQVVAREAAIPIDPGTPPDIAALIGCAVTTGIGAVLNTAGVRAGESVVVIGLGGVGLAAVMGARLAEARTIVAIDVNERKLELALKAGATHVLHASAATELLDLTDGAADQRHRGDRPG